MSARDALFCLLSNFILIWQNVSIVIINILNLFVVLSENTITSGNYLKFPKIIPTKFGEHLGEK